MSSFASRVQAVNAGRTVKPLYASQDSRPLASSICRVRALPGCAPPPSKRQATSQTVSLTAAAPAPRAAITQSCSEAVTRVRPGSLPTANLVVAPAVSSSPSLAERFEAFGPRLLRTLEVEEEGSHIFSQLVADANEAQRAAVFLCECHPRLWERLEEHSGVADPSVRRDAIEASLAQQGHPKVARARRALAAFTSWDQISKIYIFFFG